MRKGTVNPALGRRRRFTGSRGTSPRFRRKCAASPALWKGRTRRVPGGPRWSTAFFSPQPFARNSTLPPAALDPPNGSVKMSEFCHGSGRIRRWRDQIWFIRGANCLTPESGKDANPLRFSHCGSLCGRAKAVCAREDLDIRVKLHTAWKALNLPRSGERG
jgi:hypothetical protein